ncbi:MAG TPA: transposase [Actinomycetota bacterium]|nr:transposase [Actinomycetota bacterium]
MAGHHYPKTYGEFGSWFPDDTACRAYLEWLRWPAGFVCPVCGVRNEPYGIHGITYTAGRRRGGPRRITPSSHSLLPSPYGSMIHASLAASFANPRAGLGAREGRNGRCRATVRRSGRSANSKSWARSGHSQRTQCNLVCYPHSRTPPRRLQTATDPEPMGWKEEIHGVIMRFSRPAQAVPRRVLGPPAPSQRRRSRAQLPSEHLPPLPGGHPAQPATDRGAQPLGDPDVVPRGPISTSSRSPGSSRD